MKGRRVLFSFARYLLPYWKQEALVGAVSIVVLSFFVLNVQYFQSRIQRVTQAGQRQHATIMDFFKERFENDDWELRRLNRLPALRQR